MSVNLSIKNVPETLASKLRDRAARNHRSLQGELMAILTEAANASAAPRAGSVRAGYDAEPVARAPASLLERLDAIARGRGVDTTKRFTREQAHDRRALRKAGI